MLLSPQNFDLAKQILSSKVWSVINQMEDQQDKRQSFALPCHCPIAFEQHGCPQTAPPNSTQTDGFEIQPTNDDIVVQTNCIDTPFMSSQPLGFLDKGTTLKDREDSGI